MQRGIAFLLVLLICCLPEAQAANHKGIDGLINIPSAYVQLPGRVSAGYFSWRDGSSLSSNVSLPDGVELAISYWALNGGRQEGIYSGKIAVMKEKVLAPAVAVGVVDITDAAGRNFYLAVSKNALWGLRLHTGLTSGRGVFGGLEKQFKLKSDLRKRPPFIPLFALVIEHDGKNFNYGLYVRNSRGLRLDVGWLDRRFMAGVQMEF
jgi:hypothetical protein